MVIVDGIDTGATRLKANITVDGRHHALAFESQRELSDNAPEALLLLALPAAMRGGGPLVIEAPVSAQLLSQASAIQTIYRSWDSRLQTVEVVAPIRSEPVRPLPSSHAREAIAFTAGVDSFYSALGSPAAALVFVHGLDIPLRKLDLRNRVRQKLTWAAAELDRPLLEMETNLRDFSDRYLKWQLAYGGALAACALLLSRHLDVFGIPAGQSLQTFQPDGAHPVLNPLFGTESLTVRTVGCRTTRIDKIAAIATHPVVQGALRVCWENRGNTYNCGVCEKCLRTMAALEIFGVLPVCTTFAVALDYGRLSRAVARDPSLEMFIRENLQAARARNADPGLIRSIEKSLDPRRAWLLRLVHNKVPRILYDWSYRLTRHRLKSQ